MRYALIISAILASTAVFAQDNSHPERAVPYLIQQRDGALNNAAVCAGEATELQRQLTEARKQIDELKKPKDETPK
jgi:hypothetical protein